jgi:hypothetical protein
VHLAGINTVYCHGRMIEHMKTKLIIVTGVVLMSVFVIYSCTSEERFTYYLENASHYTIDSGKLDKHHFELKPNEVAGPFELVSSTGPTSFFSEPMLSLNVNVYSDRDSTYTSTDAIAYGRGMMRKNGTYLIRIVAHRDSSLMHFSLEIEEAKPRKQYSHAGK